MGRHREDPVLTILKGGGIGGRRNVSHSKSGRASKEQDPENDLFD